MTSANSDPLLAGLEEIFLRVRAYLLGEGRQHTFEEARNGKGEPSLAMDRRAEEIAVSGLRQLLGEFHLFAEERGEGTEGSGGMFSVVLDPCDGSANYVRGLRLTAFSVAVLDGSQLDLSQVRYALCGDLFSGHVYAAARGHGTTLNGVPIQASQTTALSEACIGLSVNGQGLPGLASLEVLRPIRMIRSLGASVLDLCYVADGGFDACLFLWRNLTPENFAATRLLIEEAGGRVTDHRGEPFGLCALTQPYTVVAAGNDQLHRQLVEGLREAEPPPPAAESPAAGASDGQSPAV